MRITQILENSTTAGSVATVAQPMMTQTRESVDVPGLKPVQQVIKGKAKKQGTYANSIVEGKVKELSIDLKELTDIDFKKKYGKTKAEIRASMKKEVNEEEIAEQDLIVIPGQGRLRGTGFTKHDPDRAEHEGQTLKNSLHTIIRLATHLDKELTVRDNFPEWVSEKVGSIKGDMLSVMNYIISSQEMQHDPDAINELSSALLQTAAQAATDKRNQAMDPELHNALGGGYMNPLAKHYDNVSQKMDNRAAQVKRKETIQNIASKIASPAVMRKIGMNEGSQRVDSIVTDALGVMKGPDVSDAVLALKRVLGDRAYNERRGFYSFYVDQIVDMYSKKGVAEGIVDTVKQGVNKLTSIKVKVSPYDQVWIPGTTVGYYAPGGNSEESEKENLEKLSAELKKQGINTSEIKYTDGAHNYKFTGDKYPAAWFIKVVKGKAQTVLDMLKNNKIPGYTAALPELSYPDGKTPYERPQSTWQGNPKESLEQGVAEGELEEDLSRRGFLRGLGAAALGATALGAASKAQASQDLGNGFVLTTVDVFGGKFKAVLDTQSDIHYIPNRNESGGAIVRSMAPFIMIKNGQTNTAMNVGPAAQAALKKAGLLKGVEESVAQGEIDTSRMNKQHQDFYNRNPNFKRDDREATSVGGRLATKVTPKTAQVTKKPMTPFEGDMYGDAEVSWEKGGRRAPTGAFRNPNFGNVLQKSVNKHNKAIVKTRQDIGSRIADIGAGGKEHNVKTDAAWDAAKKKVSEGYKKK